MIGSRRAVGCPAGSLAFSPRWRPWVGAPPGARTSSELDECLERRANRRVAGRSDRVEALGEGDPAAALVPALDAMAVEAVVSV